MGLRIELVPSQDGTHLLVNVFGQFTREGITIPLAHEVSHRLQKLQNAELAKEAEILSPAL